METTKISIKDFKGTVVEKEIKFDYAWTNGLEKHMSVLVTLEDNKIYYRVGTTEKSWLKQTLQEAIDKYNEL